MTSKKHQGIKEYIDNPNALLQYMTILNGYKKQAEQLMGTQFGPSGTNGHLSAKECGRIGGAITKNVFLSMAGANLETTSPNTAPTDRAVHGAQLQ